MLTKNDLLLRKTGIGASEVAAALGMAPVSFGTPLSVFLDKISDDVNLMPATLLQKVGHALEPIAAQEYEEMFNTKLEKRDELFRHQKINCLISHIDYFDAENATLVECKSSIVPHNQAWATSDLPVYVKLQCAHEAYVFESATGWKIEKVDVPVILNGSIKVYTYEREPELETTLKELLQSFWENYVVAKNPPLAYTYEEASQLFQSVPGKTVVLSQAEMESYAEAKHARDSLKHLDKEFEKHKVILANAMKDAEVALSPDGEVLLTFKSHDRTTCNFKELQKQYPDIYNKFLQTKSSRSMLFK